MRIKEIFIRRYGPLSEISLQIEEGLQLIYGANESGKTLLIDALLKRLIGERIGRDRLLNRVDETPEGYILLEDKGKEIKLERDDNLATHFNVDPDELRNIFVIRDADLRIVKEDLFFERVQDKIAGLRSEDIRIIKEQLHDQGRITTTRLELSDKQEYNKAKSQFESAKKLQNDILEYSRKAESDKIRTLEADLFDAKLNKNQLESKLEILEKAQEKQKFQTLEKALKSTKNSLSKLKRIPRLNVEALDKKLVMFEEKEKDREHLERTEDFFKKLSYFLLTIACFAILSLLFVDITNLVILIVQVITLVAALIVSMVWRNASHNISRIENTEKTLISEAQRSGFKVNNIRGLRTRLNKEERRLHNLEKKINQNIGVLKELEIKTDVPHELIEIASDKLDTMRESIDFTIQTKYDEKKYTRTKEELRKTEGKIEDLRTKLQKHKEALDDFSTRAYKLNFQMFLNKDLDLKIDNLTSLKDLLPQLEEFTNKLEKDADLAKRALEIFRELEEEEEAKISELFEKDDRASKLFRDITNNRYTHIEYNHETKRILVKDQSGRSLPVEKLSKGATDQLYLSIRLALGEKILQGKRAFFLMDDAFISSDDKRFERQVNILKMITDRKWQVIYLTAKQYVLNELLKITDNEPIILKPLP